MKNIALLIGVGVSCFLAGVIACYLWLHSQHPQASPSVAESSLAETTSAEGGAVGGNVNARAARFAALDTDHDGRLSLSEFSVGRGTTEAAKWFGRRDGDHDGFLSRQEFLPFSASTETR